MPRTSFREIAWDALGQIGSSWELISFAEREPPTWEAYWSDERKYWDADNPDKRRVQLYFGDINTEETLLSASKKKYEELKQYMLHWNGLCKRGETVQVIPIESAVVALSKNWKGAVSDHSDLELVLKEERKFFGKHVRFCCEIYSFGTRVVSRGSIEAQMGEPVGSFRVSHRRGSTPDKNEPVVFNIREGIIAVSDAKFRVMG